MSQKADDTSATPAPDAVAQNDGGAKPQEMTQDAGSLLEGPEEPTASTEAETSEPHDGGPDTAAETTGSWLGRRGEPSSASVSQHDPQESQAKAVQLANPQAVARVEPLPQQAVRDQHIIWIARMGQRGFQELGDRLSAIEAQRTSRWAEAWKSLAIVSTTAWLLLMGLVGIPAIRVELAMLLLDERQKHALGLVTEILDRRDAAQREEIDDGTE